MNWLSYKIVGWTFVLLPAISALLGKPVNADIFCIIGAMCFCTGAILREIERRQ